MPAKKDRRIQKLAVVTAVVLGSIVLLQIYWLVTSYRQQVLRFKGDVESALSMACIKVALDKVFMAKNNQLVSAVDFDDLSEAIEPQLKNEGPGSAHAIKLDINSGKFKLADRAKLLQSLKKMYSNSIDGTSYANITTMVSTGISDIEFEQSKKVFQKELANRGITTPFELAVADAAGRVYMSTGAADKFMAIPFKSTLSSLSGKEGSAGLQAAFPDAGVYVLKKMAWILVTVLLLIAIGIYSFTWLLVSFSRHRRLAEIRVDFMNNMTHELKTPVSSLTVALDMVLDDGLNLNENKKLEYLQAAQKEVQRLTLLVENTLDIISLENERVALNKEEMLLRPFVQDIATQLALLTEKRNAVINIGGVQEIPASLDRIHMGNVLQNVLENAIKYNDKQQPVIDIKASAGNNNIVISIVDNGPGIPPQYMDKIFDKFFRVPTGDLHAVKGYGLGLSYAKTIVEMHRGTISAESIPKRGCVFIIKLPMR